MLYTPVVYEAFKWEASYNGCPPSSRISASEQADYAERLRVWNLRQTRLLRVRQLKAEMKAKGTLKPRHTQKSKRVRYSKSPPPRPLRSLTPSDIHTAKMAVLRKRTPEKWVELIEAIEDEYLQLAIAKKIYWDFFTTRRWTGLNHLVFEDEACKHIRWFTRYTAPKVDDIKIALWQIGYPTLLIDESYRGKTSFKFMSRQGEDD